MTARKPYVRTEGLSVYVIGTNDADEACRLAGISPETHRWAGTGFGHYVRRQGKWQSVSSEYRLPKDARPGVAFYGPIRERDDR